MNEPGNLSGHFRLFAQLGTLFEARFLKPLWQRYPSQETDDWEAIGIFLVGYAFERQGAKPDYRHVATDVVKELARQHHTLSDANTVQLAWDLFRNYAGEEKLNYANNPLCPQGTFYERKTGLAVTYNKSIIEFLVNISRSGLPSNIVTFAMTGLQLDRTRAVHDAIQEINGIGSKIASLFLRDVAVFYNVFPAEDRYLLQPVDVWIRRAFERLAPQKGTNTEDIDMIQRWILEEAVREEVCAEAVNQGIWYFSSQIANSDYRMSKALDDLVYARALLKEYIEDIRGEVTAAEKLTNNRDE